MNTRPPIPSTPPPLPSSSTPPVPSPQPKHADTPSSLSTPSQPSSNASSKEVDALDQVEKSFLEYRPEFHSMRLCDPHRYNCFYQDIHQLNDITTNLENMCGKLGTQEDSEALRDRIWKAKDEGTLTFRRCHRSLKAVQGQAQNDSEEKANFYAKMKWFRAELDRYKKACLRVPLRDSTPGPDRYRKADSFGTARNMKATTAQTSNNNPSSSAAAKASGSTTAISMEVPEGHLNRNNYNLQIYKNLELIYLITTPAKQQPISGSSSGSNNKPATKRSPPKRNDSIKIEALNLEMKRCRTPKAVRLIGVAFGFLAIAYSWYELATYDSSDPGDAVRYLFFSGFGVLILLAEFRFGSLLEWFALLKTASGLGAFYLFVGLCAVGRGGKCIMMRMTSS
eukprot:jgi/Bigna1/69394/fgenesh1_pg.8_\